MLAVCEVAFADVAGTVLGTITDSSGAVIPNVPVVLSNAHTGFNRVVKTNGEGEFQFLAVPVGSGYEISVTAPGFEKAVHSSLTLLVNQVYRTDFQLQIGSTEQSVVVSEAAAQVETTSTQLGDVIGSAEMTDLPLNGRSYVDLLGLQPGVVPINSGATYVDTSSSGDQFTGQVSVNGAREAANGFLVNGADVEETYENGAAVIPTLDSIQEFRVLTDTFDAEYGHFSGAIVNVVTKSGTNDFHGNMFEFLRNDDLDARNYFDISGPKGSFKQNQFGGTAGGPIRKNKVFFFSDYQGTRQIVGAATLPVVPSVLERGGNFSDVGSTGFNPLTGTVRGVSGPSGWAAILTQRLGYQVTPDEPYWFAGCASTIQCVFPSEVIPQTAWSAPALKTIGFIPQPNGSNGGQPFYATSAYNQKLRDDKFGERIDWNTRSMGDFAAYYHLDDSNVVNPYAGGNVPGFAGGVPIRGQNFSVSNTITFGSTAVNVARLSFTRFADGGTSPTGGLGPISSFGFVEGGLGIVPGMPAFEGMPHINLNLLGLTFGAADSITAPRANTYEAQEAYAKIVGRHSMKFGGEFRWFQVNILNGGWENGQFSFSGGETGNDFADYLLGAPDQYVQGAPAHENARSKYVGLFAEDSFKLRPNLTLNYGLRWEVTQPWSDTQNRLQTFVPGMQSTRYPGSPTGWVFAGDPGIPSTIAATKYNKLAPRLGVAYSPAANAGLAKTIFGGPGRTSFRAGAGLYYSAFEQYSNYYETGDAPFGLTYFSAAPPNFDQPFTDRFDSTQNPCQRFPYIVPSSSNSVNWATYLPISGQNVFDRRNTIPYTEQFNFNIQRQVGPSTVVTVGYVGSVGRHLLSQDSENPANAAKCLQIRAALGPGSCGPFAEDQIFQLAPGVTDYGTRPYSVTSGRLLSQGQLDFGDIPDIVTVAASGYNALETSVQKSVGPARFLVGYTWSKSLDNMSGFTNGWDYMNPFDHNRSRGLSAFNMTHNFVASYSYNLPFDRIAPREAVAHALVAGWQVSGITRVTTGFPVSIVEGDDHALCACDGIDEPNWNGQRVKILNPREAYSVGGISAKGLYFDTSVFSPEAVGQLGNARRFFFSGPGLNNTDIALEKNTKLTERTTLQFRAEFFNVANHAQFMNPGGDIAGSNFGVITAARDPRIGQVALKLSF
jgi:hypothetical protein